MGTRPGPRTPRPTWAAARGEDGQVLLLGVGTTAVVLALVLVIATASAVYLDLKTLTQLADGAAAAAAATADSSTYYTQQDGPGTAGSEALEPAVLSSGSVQAAATRSLSTLTQDDLPGGLTDVRLVLATSPDGSSAEVTLSAHSQPLFLPWGVVPSDGFDLTASASARVRRR